MRTRIISSFLVMAMLPLNAASGQAQGSGLRGPVMGYVLDAAMQTVRPVNGIPGSSLLGDPLSLPFPVTAAAFSPRGDFGIAVSAADGAAYMLRNLGGAPTVEPIAGGITWADRVYFNTD